MRICGQEFSQGILCQINQAVAEEPTISRRVLSRRVCHWLSWRASTGGFQEGSCRKALVKLNRQHIITLPKISNQNRFHKSQTTLSLAIPSTPPDIPTLSCPLSELGSIELIPVTSRASRSAHLFRSFLDHYHPLGSTTRCGPQIRYLIKSPSHGYLGVIAFSAAAWALKSRDQYIGWSEAARISHLHHVVSNDRFLIFPTVQIKNLASHLLALAMNRLSDDWETRYHTRPVLVETFVDPSRFDGTCYKAANFFTVGQTAGRRNDQTPKTIFLYPLCPKWRAILCAEPPLQLGHARRPDSPSGWAEEEFGTFRPYDPRLKKRLYLIAQDFYNRPQANIPEACGSKAKAMGTYRFFQNPKITLDVILTPHTEMTIERIKKHSVVLAPQDTTTLNYYAHPATTGLGPINNKANKSMGLILHDTMAFTEEGTPLGILDAQVWARDPNDKGKRERRHEIPLEQKESMKWFRSFRRVSEIQRLCPETTLVSMGDRESDIYELFMEATREEGGAKLLVRAERSRGRKVEQEPLWTFMSNQEVARTLVIRVPKSGSGKAREVVTDLSFSSVTLTPPRGSKHPSIRVWAVYLREQEREDGMPRVEWMLLTTAEVQTVADAQKRVEWYSGRWGIEVYHRTLKTGCRIKDRQLGTADRLASCLGVDMVVAWRIYHLTMLGREVPEHPCTVFFEEVEWKALCCYDGKKRTAPPKPPTLREAIRMVGKMGGHLGRKGDGMPGTECIWRGLQRLDTAAEMYVIFTQALFPQGRRSYPYALLPPSLGP